MSETVVFELDPGELTRVPTHTNTILFVWDWEEFEKDLALGLLDLLKNAVEKISDYDSNQNHLTDVELNSVTIRLFIKYGMKSIELSFSLI